MIKSLFGDEYNIEEESLSKVRATLKKTKVKSEDNAEKVLKSKKVSISDRLSIINENVKRILGKQESNIIVIKDNETFNNYVNKAIESGIIAVDTETNNSTDCVTCKLMGLCLYYPNGKQAYIPVNHTDLHKVRLSWQLTEDDCRKQLQKILNSHTYILMHNGKYDYQVLKHTCDIDVPPSWDTIIAARIMDENEFEDKKTSLKSIYIKYVDPEQEKYSLGSLFSNIPYQYVDPYIFAYYAATDALMTEKVYEWQMNTFFSLPENAKLKKLCDELEMPIVQVTAEVEYYGVYIDQDFGKKLQKKYNDKLEELDRKIADVFLDIKQIIDSWRISKAANCQTRKYVPEKTKMSKDKLELMYPFTDEDGRRYKVAKSLAEQLEEPINLASPIQFAILLFDILNVPQQGESRAVGEDDLKSIVNKLIITENRSNTQEAALSLCNLLLERRTIVKLLSTYIDVIPALAEHWPDGRIRYNLNSTGTNTGRYASGGAFKFLDENENRVELNSINSQNIPSNGDGAEVRLLFKATPGYRIVGSDYSGQEVRVAAFLSQDKKLLDAYRNDQDVYAMIASEMFGYSYDDCKEFYPEGYELEIDGKKVICGNHTHINKEGKARRALGKVGVLAGNYGMSGAGAGALMHKTAKEGTELLEKYFSMFEGLASAIQKSKEHLRKFGYVEGLLGRRRRLPDINLPSYTVSLKDNNDLANFNPFLICSNRNVIDKRIIKWEDRIKKEINEYQNWRKDEARKNNKKYDATNEMSSSKYNKLVQEAAKDGVIIQANTARIAQAERQCFNALIQGSSGTLTKKAMLDIFNDNILKQCDTHIIFSVHDEILVECKEEYADIVEKRLPEVMINAAKELGIIEPKMVCDPCNVTRWYADVEAASVLDYFKKKETGDIEHNIAPLSREDAIKETLNKFKEFPQPAILKTIETGCDLDF